jgi:mechanosensitive ion channel-like protein
MRDFLEMALVAPIRRLYEELVLFVPRLLGMAILIFLGFFLGWLVAKFIRRSLVAVKFDKLCSQIGITPFLEKGNIRRPTSDLLASSIYWLIAISFFMIGLRTLNESVMSGVFSRFFFFLPNAIIAIFIFITGFMISKFIARSVLIGAVNAQIRSAKLLSMGVDLLILIFTLSLALEQLGIGQNTIVAAFSILFGGIVLALAIAFGLGGRHLAKEFLERRFLHKGHKEREEENQFSHL